MPGCGEDGASSARGMVTPRKGNILTLIYSRSPLLVSEMGTEFVYAVPEAILFWQVHGSLARRLASLLFPWCRYTGF